MMNADAHLPPGIDTERPSSARVYDYLLGGAHNFGPDRRVAERLLVVDPKAPRTAFVNRAFLRRAVDFMVGAGVRQFLDIGSGIPTVGHVHEVAQMSAPDARVAYVDIDPVAVAHSREILLGTSGTTAIRADARAPEQIVDNADVQQLLDFQRPIGVLLVALLHLVTDAEDPAGLVRRVADRVPSGSYLAISHLTEEGEAQVTAAKDVFRHSGIEITPRSHADIESFFAGWDLVEPGVVWAPEWRPEQPEDSEGAISSGIYAGVARKP